MKTKININFLAFLLLLLFAVVSFGYYFSNQGQIIEYSLSTKDIKLARPEEKDWQLKISKLNITAPIMININGNNEDEYMSALQQGVAHLAGSSLPGNIGNVFIFGHSSYYFYDKGNYKYIFKNLNDLQNNDEIVVESNIGTYKYRVVDKIVVNPEDVHVTGIVEDGKETLSLMTCTPVGTAFQRLIVIAYRI